MHGPNVVAAWALAASDRLAAAALGTGLDRRELAALTLVAEHDGCSVEWLRRRVALTQSGTVRLVDRLELKGLLSRGPATGRLVPLHVTPAGMERLEAWRICRDALVGELLAGLSDAERARVVRGMAAALQREHREREAADATCRTCTWSACGEDCPVDRSVRLSR